MEKLGALTAYFDKLRDVNKNKTYTEEDVMTALKELRLEQYNLVTDMPTKLINEVLASVTQRLAPKLNPNQEQEILNFFQYIVVENKMELPIIAKALRYLLRSDTKPKSSLVIVDVQNDFISGSLALKHSPAGQDGEEVVKVINNIIDTHNFQSIFYSIDWHPPLHCSYITNVSLYPLDESSSITANDAKVFDKVVYSGKKLLEQVMWPVHCTQGSEGAKLHPNLKVVENAIKIYKGLDPHVDSYSALWDNGKMKRTDMFGHLLDNDITHIFACGLATDFCVGMTSVDAAEHGFNVYVIMDACRGVADPTIQEMKEKMTNSGCQLIESNNIGDLMLNFK